MKRLLALSLAFSLCAACDDDDDASPAVDAVSPDAAADAVSPDAASPDAVLPDAASPDAASPDAALPTDFERRVAAQSACLERPIDAELIDQVWLTQAATGALATHEAALTRCYADAQDCAAVLRCNGQDPDAPCNPASFEERCDGAVAVDCPWPGASDASFVREVDCAASLNGNTECALVGVMAFSTCTAGPCEEVAPRCDGDVLVTCSPEYALRYDCALDGLRCSDEGVEARCVLGEDACAVAHCDGDTLVACDGGAELARVDCADPQLGLQCIPAADGQPPHCGAPAGTCTPGCEGTRARACAGRAPLYLDCAAFPGATCAVMEQGAWVRCQAGE